MSFALVTHHLTFVQLYFNYSVTRNVHSAPSKGIPRPIPKCQHRPALYDA